MSDNSQAKITSPRSYFTHLSREELLKELSDIIKRFPEVKLYIQSRYNPNTQREVFEQYKKKVKYEFFPDRGCGQARLSVLRKIVTDYKKIIPDTTDLIELMLFYAVQGVEFTLAYGDIDEAYYNNMETMYENAIQLMKKDNLLEKFRDRCKNIVNKTSDIGWGFHDDLKDIYEERYGKYE